MLCNNVDNFYLTVAELENSPSRQDGIDAQTEATLRHYGAELIQKAGILLGCHQAVMVTGQVLLQRLYCKKSLKEFGIQKMAATCTYVASKLEEDFKRLRDILLVFDRLIKRGSSSDRPVLTILEPGSREYQSAKDTVIRYERELLKAFGFIVHVEHPHNFVINYMHLLGGDKEIIQLAWNILNDSLRTTLCVRFKAEVVASGAIFYAARKMKVPLPEALPWWEMFSCTTEQLVEVVKVLHELYSRPKAVYVNVTKDPRLPKAAAPLLDAAPATDSPSVPADSGQQLAVGGDPPQLLDDARRAEDDRGTDDAPKKRKERDENGAASGAPKKRKERDENDAVSDVHQIKTQGEEAVSGGRSRASRGERERERERLRSRSRSGGSRRAHRSDSRRGSPRARARSGSPRGRGDRDGRDSGRDEARRADRDGRDGGSGGRDEAGRGERDGRDGSKDEARRGDREGGGRDEAGRGDRDGRDSRDEGRRQAGGQAGEQLVGSSRGRGDDRDREKPDRRDDYDRQQGRGDRGRDRDRAGGAGSRDERYRR